MEKGLYLDMINEKLTISKSYYFILKATLLRIKGHLYST